MTVTSVMIFLYPSDSWAWMRTLLFFSLCCSHATCRPAGGRAYRDRQVLFFHQVIPDDGIQVPQRLIGLSGQHQSLGTSVQPIAQGRGKAVFGVGVVLALRLQLGRKGIHQIGVSGSVAMAQEVRRLVQHRKTLLLINDFDRRLTARRFWCAAGRNFRKKFVIDIQFYHITLLQTGVWLGFFPVDLDALVAKRLVHHAPGKFFCH